MLTAINNVNFNIYQNKIRFKPNNCINQQYLIKTSNYADKVCFSGKSFPSEYASVFEYLAAEILGRNKKYQVDGSMLSASKIKEGVRKLFETDKVYTPFKRSSVEKIKWKSYIPQDVRQFSIDKINLAREVRLNQWREFLENPDIINSADPKFSRLSAKIKNNKSLKLVIWDAITSEIKENNRHIPVPFDENALYEAVKSFVDIAPKDRVVRCAAPSFLEIYTHRLRDNLLMDMGLSGDGPVWVKIPSIRHDFPNSEKNIKALEVLSCKNWCTRSSVDKAKDALEDGDFYIYLQRKDFRIWDPVVGMTTCGSKIDQIQGEENNNIVPLGLVGEIKSFIQKSGLKCRTGIESEGPKATQALMISEKLNETSEVFKKNFNKAIKDKDDLAMLNFLEIPVTENKDGLLTIKTYKPSYSLNADSGLSVPYSMFGLDEDELLKNVKIIDGNLVLANKNGLFNSRITKFPPHLEKVTGRVICTEEQYEKFSEDINKVVNNQGWKIIVH